MLRPLTLTLIACLTIPAGAAAQFGNLTKKAKEKAAAEAAKAVGAKPAEGTLKFDNTMLELTPPVVNQLLAGLKVRANTKDAQGRNSAQLRQRADELAEEARQLDQSHGNERAEFNNKLGAAQNCVSEVMNGFNAKHQENMQRRFMGMTGANLAGDQSANAKFMQEFQRISMGIAEAAAASDTAKANKLQVEYNKLMGIDAKADSAKARAQCNVPPAPPWMARADAAYEESNRLYNQARELEAKSNQDAVKASGLTAEQFVMGVERVTAYCAGGGGLWRFSKNEEAALKAASAQLKPLVG
jgi:hypothetical protein